MERMQQVRTRETGGTLRWWHGAEGWGSGGMFWKPFQRHNRLEDRQSELLDTPYFHVVAAGGMR
jgi:hypothetical protein